MLNEIVKIIGLIVLFIFILHVAYVIVKIFDSLKYFFTPKKVHKSKFRFKVCLQKFKYIKMITYLDFIKWIVIDALRGKDKLRLFGIKCFTGYYGEGKTLGAVTYALELKAKYPDIKIYANFRMRGVDGLIKSPQDIVDLEFTKGRKIIIFDEIQSTFASTKFAEFPMELLWGLTQCRKNQMCVFANSPVYTRMSIQLRESCDEIVVCKNILHMDRWFSYTHYHTDVYERLMDDKRKLKKERLYTHSFIATDKHYRAYNTKAIVERWELEDEKKTVSKRTQTQFKNELVKIVEDKLKLFEKKLLRAG